MKIAIFYHCAMMGDYWQQVDNEITKSLFYSKLIEKADIFEQNKTLSFNQFEFPTLNMIHDFANDNNNYAILYLHTKGVSYKYDKECVKRWRDVMLYWLVEQHEKCLYKLAKGYDVVGCRFLNSPMPHFQGNFFWTTTKHVKRLCKPIETQLINHGNFEERHKAEMWICSTNGNFYSMFDWKVNPYCDLITNDYKQKKIL